MNSRDVDGYYCKPITSQPRATSSLMEVQRAATSVQSAELRRLLSSKIIKLRHKRRCTIRQFGSWCNDECEIFSHGMDTPCLSAMQTSLRNLYISCPTSQEIHVVPVTYYKNEASSSVTPCLSVETRLTNTLLKSEEAVVQFPPGDNFGTITYSENGWMDTHAKYKVMNSDGSLCFELETKNSNTDTQKVSSEKFRIRTILNEERIPEIELSWRKNKNLQFKEKILSFGFLLYYVMKSEWLSRADSEFSVRKAISGFISRSAHQLLGCRREDKQKED